MNIIKNHTEKNSDLKLNQQERTIKRLYPGNRLPDGIPCFCCR